MKKFANKILLISVIVSLFFMISQISFAGIMADVTDSDAENLSEKQMEEQNKTYVDPIGKSSDNFLESLSVEGYTLTPEFDKQTINYEIKEKVKSNEITINAKAENDKAKVTNIGKISLTSGENNIKVDVTAENGVMRSYFINVKTDESASGENSTNEMQQDDWLAPNEEQYEEESNLYSIDGTNANSTIISPNKSKMDSKLIIAIVIVVIIILLFILLKRSKKESKHSKHSKN